MKRSLFAAATALLSTLTAQAATIDLSKMTLNGGATATANELTLVDGQLDMATSAFMAAIPTPSQFSGSFDFTLSQYGNYSPQADGLSFMIQDAPQGAKAVGAAGSSIGAAGVQNAIGIGFQSYVWNHATIFTTSSTPQHGSQGIEDFSLGSNRLDTVKVDFKYNKDTLSYSAFNSNTGKSIKGSSIFDLGELGQKVFIGFTGGSGSLTSVETVSDFQFRAVSGVPESSTWAMMGLGFAGLGVLGYRRNKTASVAA
jgi:hypothetical protein